MKSAIVTGANGFVGGALVRELLENNYVVYAVIHRERKDRLSEHPRLQLISAELSEIERLCQYVPTLESGLFFHLAWEGSAGEARSNASLQLKNAEWSVRALQTAKMLGCNRFIGAGSIMEHETIAATFTPGNRPGMAYIYGDGKLTAHLMCSSVAAKLGIDLVWPVITNAYGIGEISPRIVNATLRKCLNGTAPEFTSATQNYDFVYVDDAARAFRLIGERGKAFHEYVIGSGAAKPLREFLLEMRETVAPKLEFRFGSVPFTGINLPLEIFDTASTAEDCGFKPSVSFPEGCRMTYEWLKKVSDYDSTL